MKILFVVNDYDFFISHRYSIALQLIHAGDEVHVLSNKKPKGRNSTIIYHSFHLSRSGLGPLDNIKSIVQLHIVIRNVRPDIIHNVTLKPIIFSSILLIFNRKINLVNAISGLGYMFTDNRYSLAKYFAISILKCLIKTRSPHFIFQNKQDLNEFKKLGLKENYTIIKGSGVDAHKFSYLVPSKTPFVRILFTGRILKDKGVIELLEACSSLLKKGLPIELKLLGKLDPLNPTHITKEELESYCIPDRIAWEGFSTQIKDELQNCHIYCLPSYREGLPKSIVEAMAIGRPIVTTNAPGCSDCVQEGKNGFKVPIKDTQQLAEKLELLINDSQLREQMGKTSRKIFEKEFTLAQVVQQHMTLYNKLRTFENTPL